MSGFANESAALTNTLLVFGIISIIIAFVCRVDTAGVSDKLVDKKVVLVPQSTLLRCCFDFLGFSFQSIIRIFIRRWYFNGEGSVNAGNELWILDSYFVCFQQPAPCSLTID